MTIRVRLALSLVGILVFFGCTFAVVSWGTHARNASVESLTQAVRRRVLLVTLEQHVAQRRREIAVLGSLVAASGSANLAPEQVAQTNDHVEAINREVRTLHTLADAASRSGIADFEGVWEKLAKGWKDELAHLGSASADTPFRGSGATDALAEQAVSRLRDLQGDEQTRVEQAIAGFRSVAQVTNRLTMALFGVAFLAMLGAALHMSSFLNKGLSQLREGARRIGGGELGFRIRRNSADELSDLAAAFNAMAVNLAQAHREANDARAVAENANKAKSAFLASMSHELRTPMNAIIGYSEILLEDAEAEGNEMLATDLKKIRSAGKHLLALINDVLDLSKIEAGKMTLLIETFDAKALIEDVATTVSPLVEKNGNAFEVKIADNFTSMRADQTKVRQSLLNLLSNAAKFTKQGTIQLRAALESRKGVDWAIMEVEDSGIGLRPDQVEKIFEEFSQAEDSTSKDYGGTGLGLPISRKFCRLMGGDITVTSEPGKGSVFRIAVPAEVVDPNAKPAAPTSAKAQAAPRADATGPRPAVRPTDAASPGEPVVLLIDDDLNVLELTKRTLEREGFQVVTASSGAEGVKLAAQHRPAAITLDLMMPGMDGWAVLSELKKNPTTAAIPVILVTMLDDRASGLALGACEYLTKPVDKVSLVPLLRRFAGGGAAPGTALVVDDDANTRGFLRRVVEPEGWSVREAGDGAEALKLVGENRPDLILLDLMMPNMDGFEFLRQVRGIDGGQDIPVIVITSKDLSDEERARLNGSVTQVLQKSASDSGELLGEITRLLWRFSKAKA